MDLLVEVFEFAACVAQEELAFDPDGEAEDVCKEQRAIERDAAEVLVQDQAAPGREKAKLAAQPKAERKKDQRGDKDGIGDHERYQGTFSRNECAVS
ncbi:MAG: hypothetical protein HIU93_03965 [Acidobacteria bacterium]|nr:hypothetical protein [Acidobacteriota bacterium]